MKEFQVAENFFVPRTLKALTSAFEPAARGFEQVGAGFTKSSGGT